MSNPRVAVVILNWNGWRDSLPCLESLRPAVAQGLAWITIVDNASTDESAARLRAWLHSSDPDFLELAQEDLFTCCSTLPATPPTHAFIQAARNGGYAAGNNLGINLALRFSDAEYLFVLNNDTVVDPTCISHLVEFADRELRAGVVGSTLIEDRGRVRIAGGNRFNPWLTTNKPVIAGWHPSPTCMDYVVGAAQFIRAEVLRQVGLFSEDYFLYFEELDFTRRVARAGFHIAWCPEAVVYHDPGRAAGSRSRINQKKSTTAEYHSSLSCLIFMRKYHPHLLWFAAPLRFFLKAAHAFIHRQPELVTALIRAYRDYLVWTRKHHA